MQNFNAIQVLPQPRTIPKSVIWIIYAITAICLTVAILTVIRTDDKSKPKTGKDRDRMSIREQTIRPTFEARMKLQGYEVMNPEPKRTTVDYREPAGDVLQWKPNNSEQKDKYEKREPKKCDDPDCHCDDCQCADTSDCDISQRLDPDEVPGLNLVTLEEIVDYETRCRPRIRNLSWFEESCDEVIDWVSPSEVAITSVTAISPRFGDFGNCSDAADRPNERQQHQHVRAGGSTGRRAEEPAAGEIAGKNDGADFGAGERPRRHVATLHGCRGEGHGGERMRCRFVARVLSTMLDDVNEDFARNLAARFWTVARNRPGVYGFGHEVPSEPKEIKRHVHRCRYVVRIPLNSSDTTCVIKAQEDYEYLWTLQQGVHQPKYIITTTESCPNYELTWTDEYEFDSAKQANLHLVYQLSTDVFKWPPKSSRRSKRNEKRNTRNNKTSRCVGAAAGGGDGDAGAAGTEPSRTGDCEEFRRPQPRGTRSDRREYEFEKQATDKREVHQTGCATDASDEEKFDCQLATLIGTRTFVEKPFIEYERIGKTDWIVHTISQWNEELEASILSLAMSNGTKLLADLKESRRLDTAYQWIPVAGRDYKPLVASDIYVTHLVAIRLASAEEATVFYIGSPVANLSRRTKLDVPPLEYSTFEPADCMTCPGVPVSPTSPNEGGLEVSGVGHRPQCIYSEVVMSKTREKYILKCWGPDFPWVSVVATCPNVVTNRLEIMADRRKVLAAKVQPARREYSSLVGGAARVHLPPDLTDESGRCRRRAELLLVINDAIFDQLVDAEYDLSLAAYLATVKGYAVLYVDPRANFYDAVDASKMKMHERESEQLSEYLRMVHEAVRLNPCIKSCKGFGLLGKHYGAHLVLNFVADEWHGKDFRCSAAVRPFAPWQRYVYPFHEESPDYAGNSTSERKMTRDISPFEGYMEQLVSQLPGKNLFLYVGNPNDPELKPYVSLLQSLAERYELPLQFHDSSRESDYDSKLKLYKALVKYFEDCFKYEET